MLILLEQNVTRIHEYLAAIPTLLAVTAIAFVKDFHIINGMIYGV